MKFNSANIVLPLFSLWGVADLKPLAQSEPNTPTFPSSNPLRGSPKPLAYSEQEDYDGMVKLSGDDGNNEDMHGSGSPYITSYKIDVLSVLSHQLSCAMARHLLDNEEFVFYLRELIKHVYYNEREIDLAIDEICSRITLKDVRDIFSQNINGRRVPRPAEDILNDLVMVASYYCNEFPTLGKISDYVDHMLEIIEDDFANIRRNAMADIYDEKHASTLFRLFLIKLYHNTDACLPIFTSEAESLLSEDEKREFNEKFIECISRGLRPTVEQTRLAENIPRYFLNLACNILSLTNDLILALDRRDDEGVDIIFAKLIGEFKMFYVQQYRN